MLQPTSYAGSATHRRAVLGARLTTLHAGERRAEPESRYHDAMRYALLVSVFVAGAAAAPAGHHSLAGIYDSANPIRFDAVVVEFQFIHPHPFVVVERRESGRMRQWRLEMDNRFELAGIGMTATTLREGDRVTVSGSPARDGSPGLYLRRLDRPADGFWYEQVGSSPRVGQR